MKVFKVKLAIVFLLATLILTIVGCKDEIEQPPWDKGFKDPPTPVITAVNPVEALPGINKITITGNTFADTLTDNKVYFDNIQAEIVDGSATFLTVLRPKIAGDATTIKVLCNGALVVAKYTPYKVSSVMDVFVSSPTQLNAIEIDRNENLYFADQLSSTIYRVSPLGSKDSVAGVRSIVSDIKFSPSGKLILISPGISAIDQVDFTTGNRTPWVTLVKQLYYGDFDTNGNFYVGGLNRSLYVVRPDTSRITVSGYTTDNILYLRVYNGYVYILTARSELWRNQIINATGSLSAREKVLDLIGGVFPKSPQKFTFSADGLLYIASNDTSQRTVVTYDLSNATIETVYKGIIPNSPVVRLVWGTGTNFYLMTSGTKYDILRIDVGKASAPYYGR